MTEQNEQHQLEKVTVVLPHFQTRADCFECNIFTDEEA
jgi:hypothetical protein